MVRREGNVRLRQVRDESKGQGAPSYHISDICELELTTALHSCCAASSAVDTAAESHSPCTHEVTALMNSWLWQRQVVLEALQSPVEARETQSTKQSEEGLVGGRTGGGV